MFLFTEYANHFHERNWHSGITAVLGDCRRTKSPGRVTKSFEGISSDDNVTKLGVTCDTFFMTVSHYEGSHVTFL